MSGCLHLCDFGIPMCLTLLVVLKSALLSREYGMLDRLAVCSGNFFKHEITFLSSAVKEQAAVELMIKEGISNEGLMYLLTNPATQVRWPCLLPQLCTMLGASPA